MVRAAGGKLLLRFRRQRFEELAVFGLDGKRLRDVPLPSLGAAYFLPITRWDSDEVFYVFSSVAHPITTFRFDLATGERSVWSGSEEAGALDVSSLEVSYASKDGTTVPLLLMMKRGLALDGNRMVLLTAYGAYGNVRSPFFDPLAHAVIRRGGVYAFAGIRGGGEFGTDWHRGGMLDKKQNSYDDFIAAAEWLIANKYTRASRLGIHGASAGGMLVAGAALQRPDLFGAVISINGHFDMLRYHKFSQGAAFVPEFGNPDVAEDFAYLRRYSPYHQVRSGARYPAMLFITGGTDTRVAPLHSRKLVARLQASIGAGGPILLRYEMMGGHSRVDAGAEGVVDELAFFVSQLGEPAAAVAK
jgi:prolyl oligopeptidase